MIKPKYIIKLLTLTLGCILFTGCGKAKVVENYSVGLDQAGYYENFSKQQYDIPNLLNISVSQEELLDLGKDNLSSYFKSELGVEDTSELTTEKYVETYASQFLTELGLSEKEIVENNDLVDVTLVFKDKDGNLIPEYSNGEIATYTASETGDSITKSFLGHKINDVYTTEYVFTDSDEIRAGTTATVEVTIKGCRWADPLANGILESNLEEIQKNMPNVTDKQSYIDELTPYIAQENLYLYVNNLIESVEMEVPKKYIDYERDRLLFRLQQIGVSYDAYLIANNTTEEDTEAYLKSIVISNLITMDYFSKYGVEITDDLISEFYNGQDIEYLASMQGYPYLKLRMMREYVLNYIISTITMK